MNKLQSTITNQNLNSFLLYARKSTLSAFSPARLGLLSAYSSPAALNNNCSLATLEGEADEPFWSMIIHYAFTVHRLSVGRKTWKLEIILSQRRFGFGKNLRVNFGRSQLFADGVITDQMWPEPKP